MAEESPTPPAEKKPTPWPQFVADALAKLRAQRDRLRAPTPLSEEKAKEREKRLWDERARGERVRGLLAAEVWKQDLEPWLREQSAAAVMRPWAPGDPFSFAALRTEYFFQSGKAWLVRALLNQLTEWARAGDEAKKELEALLAERAKKRKEAEIDARRFS
jgi:hypothetical protein